MKKVGSFVLLLMITLLLSGCVKYNASMDIKKDKSMDFKIIYAFDTSVLGEAESFSEEELKKIKEQGFEVSKYSEGNMKGYTLTKKIDNIDDVSSESDLKYSLSGITSNSDSKIFKIKKGFFKNKYIAKFDFNASESGLDDPEGNALKSDSENTFDSDSDLENDSLEESSEDDGSLEENSEDETDYSQQLDSMNNLDLSFSVTLPYAAKSNNATNVKNDGKELVWNLVSNNNTSTVEFEFELYNFSVMSIIIGIGIVIGVLFVVALIITIIMAIKGGKKKVSKAE